MVYNPDMICTGAHDTAAMDATAAAGSGHAASVSDVCFSYGDAEVLHNVSFTIPRRAMVAVIGPNGGGKSTLLHLLLGALRPTIGSLYIIKHESFVL